jgi:hypothetical protein
MQSVGARWLEAEKSPPVAPAKWTGEKQDVLVPRGSMEVRWEKAGVIRQWRLRVDADDPELMQQFRLQIFWDGSTAASVDAPIASFFGYAKPANGDARFNSMLLGIAASEAYCCFPMPFGQGARLVLTNRSAQPFKCGIKWESESMERLPSEWGRFHATYRAEPAGMPDAPRFGRLGSPAHVVFDQPGPGKYVGTMMQVTWPWRPWWGEGDWLIWTDATDWPPRYHGTTSEAYFNSGRELFDRKAISGFVATKGAVKSVYSFHLNDAFSFQSNIRVAVETVPELNAHTLLNQNHPIWATTALWYAPTAQPANSTDNVYLLSQLEYVQKAASSQPTTQSGPATGEGE